MKLCALLPEYVSYFAPYTTCWRHSYVDYHLERGNAIFAKKSLYIQSTWIEYFDPYDYNQNDTYQNNIRLQNNKHQNVNKNIQYIILNNQWNKLLIVNIHGLYTGTWKGDTEERIKQFSFMKEFINMFAGKVIVVWDLNLDPDTKSIAILAEWMNNLIVQHEIQTTRSKLYDKYGKINFADYAFVSLDLIIKNFTVPYSEASDHLPLIIEI